MRDVEKLIFHCSGSSMIKQDSIEAIKDLHTSPKTKEIIWGIYLTHGKGWDDVGYQYFIDSSGILHKGRSEDTPGAHCYGHNRDSIGICFSGDGMPTPAQFATAVILSEIILDKYGLTIEDVFGHNFFNHEKSCPNFDIEILRDKIKSHLDLSHQK